ncbi:hypothetical protein DNTS_023140 [Danionella cerebrum]|uniref:F5/8 type C domain-containing protein n=1 Tax=Danionella cerebrum TaxID=2873325 RepID=A0A553QBJ8_9TELE|nr:hypothetical protein DNTS_023140 [Danionella translucida]
MLSLSFGKILSSHRLSRAPDSCSDCSHTQCTVSQLSVSLRNPRSSTVTPHETAAALAMDPSFHVRSLVGSPNTAQFYCDAASISIFCMSVEDRSVLDRKAHNLHVQAEVIMTYGYIWNICMGGWPEAEQDGCRRRLDLPQFEALFLDLLHTSPEGLYYCDQEGSSMLQGWDTLGLLLPTTKCRYALGMEDGAIPDSAITASSAWSDSTEAKHGRLSTGEGDGAWCPAGSVFPSGSEYLQVDLQKLHFLSLVGTQGRHADGLGREFARSYRLHYSRDGRHWMIWKDRWGQEVVTGNENTYDAVLKDLGPPIIARMVRFYPLADRVMSVCLRVELYGCVWKAMGFFSLRWAEGLHCSGGHVMDSVINLNDSIYDGSKEAGVMFGGLGQLCDGVLGGNDFTNSKELRVWPGYDYVGWNRETLGKATVDIEFHFEKTRIFHTMQVHSNNRHTQGVRVFSEVLCEFKAKLLSPWSEPALSLQVSDLHDLSSRTVSLPLGGRPAQIIRCHFTFADVWLLISEISFYSGMNTHIANGTLLISEVHPQALALEDGYVLPPLPSSSARPLNATFAPYGTSSPLALFMTESTLLPSSVPSAELSASTLRAGLPVAKDDSSNTAILIGCLVGIILLLLAIIVVILWRQYWKKLLGKAQGSLSSDELRVHLSVPSDNVVINNTSTHTYSSRYQRIHTFPDDREREGEYQEPSTVLRGQRDSTGEAHDTESRGTLQDEQQSKNNDNQKQRGAGMLCHHLPAVFVHLTWNWFAVTPNCPVVSLLLNNPAYHLLLPAPTHGPRLTNCPGRQEKLQNLPQGKREELYVALRKEQGVGLRAEAQSQGVKLNPNKAVFRL